MHPHLSADEQFAALNQNDAALLNEHDEQTSLQLLNAIFQSIHDGVTLFDTQQHIVRENRPANLLRSRLEQSPQGRQALQALLYAPACQALRGHHQQDISVTIVNERSEQSEYLVTASPLYQQAYVAQHPRRHTSRSTPETMTIGGAAVAWHDITPIAMVVHQDGSAMKEAEELKDEFISIAAHELRNPLSVLQGFVELFQRQMGRQHTPMLTEEQRESLQHIDQATRRLVTLTNDLLDVTRLQAGHLELVEEVTDLVSLVKRVTQRHQSITPDHQLMIIAQDPFLIVSIDVMLTEQVFTNLLTNAIKYSPGGGPIQITLEKQVESQQVLIKIKDQGIGIPACQQAQIFGRFVRATNAQSHGLCGTGLGLYLSRELIKRQGGDIWFQSQEGQGTTFFVALPLLAVADT
ncbi:sensor histidine kinase [Dictyobacter aurantiacus]|uniref:histidine kinase n=1 Tax=Dictyobacter aurantiacus TaxID=1936993 RepID=A0A401ZI59_9CHLR|nr:HAMP domain-containing sensor histidine kinase [Dictyobacter aurantiacus]GCE06531.1 hypothetical protein KDAU_38600 [Dictyobacter aurantiacus]